MTRLLVIGQSYGRGHAATSDLFTDLAEGLAETGWPVEVLTSAADGAPASSERVGGVMVHYVSRRGLRLMDLLPVGGRLSSLASLWLALVGWCLFTRQRYTHVIVLDSPHLLTLSALILKLRHRTAAIAWVMDRPLLQIQRLNPSGSLKAAVAGFLNQWQVALFRRCDMVVTLGDCMATTLIKEGVSPSRIAIIRTWDRDDLPIRSIPAQQAREQAGLPQRFTVMYSGYAGAWHDFEPVLACIQELAFEPHLQFLFVGDGPGIKCLQQWCTNHPDAHVIFRPYVPRHERDQSLCCGDLHLVCLKPSMLGTCVPSKLNAPLGLGRPVLVVAPHQCQSALDVEATGSGFCTPTGDDLIAAVRRLSSEYQLYASIASGATYPYRAFYCHKVAVQSWNRVITKCCR